MNKVIQTIDGKIELYQDGTWKFLDSNEFISGNFYKEHGGFYTHSSKTHHYFIASNQYKKQTKWSNVYEDNPTICVKSSPPKEYEQFDPRINGNIATAILAENSNNLAACHCRSLITDEIHSDWFLPSIFELKEILNVKDEFNKNSIEDEQLTGCYWSSTEYGSNSAWGVYFSNGNVYANYKDGSGSVRAVRKVTI